MKREKNWLCPYCGRGFVAEKSMQRHINLGCGDTHRWKVTPGSSDLGDPGDAITRAG